MMKYNFTLLLIFLTLFCFSQNNLKIKVTGIKILKGEVKIGIYNNESGWDKDMKSHLGENTFQGQRIKVDSNSITANFTNLPIYHFGRCGELVNW